MRTPRSLAEIIDDYWLYARCLRCGHQAILDLPGLVDRYGRHATLSALKARLHCSRCGDRIATLVRRHRYGRAYDPVLAPRG